MDEKWRAVLVRMADDFAAFLATEKAEDRPFVRVEFQKLVNAALNQIDRDARATILKFTDNWGSERWIG